SRAGRDWTRPRRSISVDSSRSSRAVKVTSSPSTQTRWASRSTRSLPNTRAPRALPVGMGVVRRRTTPIPTGSARGALVFGKLRVDRDAHRVWVDGEEVTLTALELRLLSTLMERRGRVQSRPALLDDVWGMSGEVTTRTVDTHVKRLREKLGNAGLYIETVRGVGYRFTPAPDHAGAAGTNDDEP